MKDTVEKEDVAAAAMGLKYLYNLVTERRNSHIFPGI